MTRRIPVADGGLALDPRKEDGALLETWLPRPHPAPEPSRSLITLGPLAEADHGWVATQAARGSTLAFGSIRAWVDTATRRVALTGRLGQGVLDLARGTGTVDPGGALDDGYTMLTMAAGMLLAAQGRVLVHAGAVLRPDGGVLLLAGDTHSGKSTTTITLARAPGWSWLADDQVVLALGPDEAIEVLAWARRPHLDAGYHRGDSVGERSDVDPSFLNSLPWIPRGRLQGLLLPRVVGDAPSRIAPAPAAAALEALIRQGAWIMAEAAAARAAMRILTPAAAHGVRHLELGLDCYARPDRLVALLDATS